MQNPRCILKIYLVRLYLYKQPLLVAWARRSLIISGVWTATSSTAMRIFPVLIHYSGAVAPAVAPHDIPKKDTGGGTKSGSHQMRLFVQTQAHGVDTCQSQNVRLIIAVVSTCRPGKLSPEFGFPLARQINIYLATFSTVHLVIQLRTAKHGYLTWLHFPVFSWHANSLYHHFQCSHNVLVRSLVDFNGPIFVKM